MNTQEKAEAMLGPIKTWREAMWNDLGVKDVPPTIGFLIDGNDNYDYCPTEFINELIAMSGDDPDMGGIVHAIVFQRSTFEGFTKYREITAVLDSYSYEGDGEMPDSLANDFKTNLTTKVTEQVTLIVAADDLVGGVEVVVGMLPYSIDDGGVMVWGEPRFYDDDYKSRIVDAMKWGVLHAGQE